MKQSHIRNTCDLILTMKVRELFLKNKIKRLEKENAELRSKIQLRQSFKRLIINTYKKFTKGI